MYVCLRVYRALWGGARACVRVQGSGFKSHIDEKMLEGFESMFFTQPSIRLRGKHRAMPQVLGQAMSKQTHRCSYCFKGESGAKQINSPFPECRGRARAVAQLVKRTT